MVWPMSEKAGTATWLDKVPGGPPLRFDPLPGGTGQRRCTKEEKRAVVDYALEVRKTKFAGECAKEIGIGAATLSDWIRAECQTYQAFSCLDLDSRALRTIDYRALLVDLRGGKMPICISDYIGAGKCPKQFFFSKLSCKGADATASAIGERQSVEWPVKDHDGTAVWKRKLPGEPPLRFNPLPEGKRQRNYTEAERCAIVNYALEVRKTKNIGTCAKEMGIGSASLSHWLKWGCEAYRIFSDLNLDTHTLRAIDYRELLADLRSGIRSVTVSDYTGGLKFSARKSTVGIKLENVPAQEEVQDGHPYFLWPEKGTRRVFTEEQKARAVDYWLDEFAGKSLSECARECNLSAHTLGAWTAERDSEQACPDTEEPSEGPYAKEECGTATWLDKVPGGPPLRFDPLPGGRRRRRLTEEEWNAIVDYVLEVRKTKSVRKCAKEMGLTDSAVSTRVRNECKTNTTFLRLGLNGQDLWGVDYRELLVDLRAGKSSIRIADYTGAAKYANRNRSPGTEPMSARTKECARDAHPYLTSAGEGERRVFAEGQRKRTVNYRSHACMGGSISGCSRECNLGEPPPIDWVDDTYGRRASKRFCPNTTEPSENLPGGTASDSYEDRLPGVSWQDPEGWYPEYLSNLEF